MTPFPENDASRPAEDAETVRKPIDLEAIAADESDPDSDRSPSKTDRDFKLPEKADDPSS